ncbi:MAG: prolyl oligopeptidase family serine peptidase [Flavobacteriaceae bacterium]|nr:prolyl oligopeptidase family serine peptidase [Flavobacteriaceae bacterium]
MKKSILTTLAIFIFANAFTQQKWNYPATPKIPVYDTIWGKVIQDDYRWMEDVKDTEMVSWLKSQADFTNNEIAKIQGQQKLIEELKSIEAMRSAFIIPVSKAGGKNFYRKRIPGQQTSKLYYRTGSNGKEILLFDPEKYVEGKVMDFSASTSHDGSKLIIQMSEQGTETGDIRVMDVATGKFLDDVIPHSYGRFAGTSNTDIIYVDQKGYDVHNAENRLNRPVKLHTLGKPVSSDLLIVDAKKYPELGIEPRDMVRVEVPENSPFIVVGLYTALSDIRLFYAPKSELKNQKINWKKLAVLDDEIQQYFLHGNDIYFLTTKGNPKFRITKTSLINPDLQKVQIIAEGDAESHIASDAITQVKDYLFYSKTKNEVTVRTYQLNLKTGKSTELKTRLKGNVMAFPFGDNHDDNEVHLVNIGWNVPYNFYSYRPETDKLTESFLTAKLNYPNLENIVAEEIEIPSHDGVMVPLSIVYDKNKLKKDGSNTAFMQGYGSYGMSAYVPALHADLIPLLNRGVVLAFPHVRGGGEKGHEWYLAGKKTNKPNTWKDFNAAAEYLIKNKYTSPEKFAISGASAGGILIGRAITERPDLYKVAIPKVGAMNTLRMEFSPNGPVNTPEFGTIKDETEFKALLEMDSFHHIIKGVKYPAQLITTGFNDSRVDSFIPAKYAAKMQDLNGSTNPVFLDVDYKAGHFGGSTADERNAQHAKEFAFIFWQTGHPDFQPKK